MKNEITDVSYWESSYVNSRRGSALPRIDDFRQLPTRRIIDLCEKFSMEGRNVLEVGAGNSEILGLLTKRNADKARFSGLDYTESGCASLSRMASQNNLSINVIRADMFRAPENLVGEFDLVYSIGVVEHFRNLEEVVAALRRLLAPGGLLISVIPNMRGALGYLTKQFNRAVYDIHNPHTLESLVQAHSLTGLDLLDSGYLCSTNFGVLASCVTPQQRLRWQAYVALTRLSKLFWFFESRTADAFHSQFLSPYLYVVMRDSSGTDVRA